MRKNIYCGAENGILVAAAPQSSEIRNNQLVAHQHASKIIIYYVVTNHERSITAMLSKVNISFERNHVPVCMYKTNLHRKV